MIEPLGELARMADNQRYRITERIDAGGMAEVFRGVAESAVGGLKKAVAIKRILPNLTKNKKFVSMFLDEARVSMHLQHANIVGVFDIGMADTAYFIVMEFVDGANLKTIIESLRRQGQRMTRGAHALHHDGGLQGPPVRARRHRSRRTGASSASCTATSRRRTS